jgi:8-oxo-dGTP pyrophosphatase MutT (NUDIX family)
VPEEISQAVTERAAWHGRQMTVRWIPAPFRPPGDAVLQAYGVCFSPEGRIVLVSRDGSQWNLPGGHPEAGETMEEALRREVWEEACARVLACEYLGCQAVDDPGSPEGLDLYYQARFWARVELLDFKPHFERRVRHLVPPSEFLAALQWGNTAVGAALLEAACAAEYRARRPEGGQDR